MVAQWKTWTVVGASFGTTRRATADFSYTDNQHSTLGVAVRYSAGGYQLGGTMSMEKSASIKVGFPLQRRPHAKLFETMFRYQKVRVVHDYPGRNIHYTNYFVKPYGFAGGSKPVRGVMPRTNDCVRYAAGSDAEIVAGSAITWSNGVSAGAAFGVDLSSQTGYGENAAMVYKFKGNSRLCSQLGSPGDYGLIGSMVVRKAR